MTWARCNPRGEGRAPGLAAAGSNSLFAPWVGTTWIFPCYRRDMLTYGFPTALKLLRRQGNGGDNTNGKREKAVGLSCLLRSYKRFLFQNTNIYSRHNSVMTVSVPSHIWKWNLYMLYVFVEGFTGWGLGRLLSYNKEVLCSQ